MGDRIRRRYGVLLLALGLMLSLAVSCGGGGGGKSPEPPTVIADPFSSTPAIVRVELLLTDGQKATTRYWGTGAFVGPGVVMTSARLLDSAGGWDTIGIAAPGRNGEATTLAYQADIVAIDPSLDVALLRVAADTGGKDVRPDTLRHPVLSIVPENEKPDYRSGLLVGYTALNSPQAATTRLEFNRGVDGGTEWLEAPLRLPSGFGGAPVLDDKGRIIGVVALPEGVDEAVYVRRIAEVRSLVKAATSGGTLVQTGRERLPAPDRVAVDKPRDIEVSGIAFYQETSATGEPIAPLARFPSGTRRIVYAFSHKNMRPGAPWLDEWSVNGRVDTQLSPARPPWDRAANGRVVSSISDPKGLPDGVYVMRVVVDGIEIATGSVTVGDEPAKGEFHRAMIALDKGKEHQPLGQAERLETATQLVGFFEYRAMPRGQIWGYVWYHDGRVVLKRERLQWKGGRAGSDWWVALYHPDRSPLAAGTYTLSLLIDGEPTAVASVVVNRGP